MAKRKYVSIKSFNDNDVKEMFEFICKNICMKTVDEIKDLMDIDGAPDATDLINLIKLYDIPLELKCWYIDSTFDPSSIPSEPLTPAEPDYVRELKDQTKDVSDESIKKLMVPDFKVEIKPDPSETRKIDTSLIPPITF